MPGGVRFRGFEESGVLVGVMGIQEKDTVTLIRHAYVRTSARNKGVGSQLLQHLQSVARKPILIGTWADAAWAIPFYEKHGYRLIGQGEKVLLLQRFWSIPSQQVETSVVLASPDYKSHG